MRCLESVYWAALVKPAGGQGAWWGHGVYNIQPLAKNDVTDGYLLLIFNKKRGAGRPSISDAAMCLENRRLFEEIDGYPINCQRSGRLNFIRNLDACNI